MGAGAGLALRTVQLFIRGIQLGCAALILAIYSYFLAALNNHKISISNTVRAVEGISGITCLYAIAAILFVCCFAGRTLPSFLGFILDLAFIACFIFVAVANKGGAGSCEGYLDTPFGKGKAADKAKGSDGFTALPSYRVACRLQTACLAVSIIAIFFFIFSILTTVALARHHHREKRFGPGPQNDYTSGYGKAGFLGGLFRRKTNRTVNQDNQLPEHPLPDQMVDNGRNSHGTDNTAVEEQHDGTYNKYDTTNTGYGYPQPQGQGRQDGYGYIHYPEPDDHDSHLHQQGYRYGDGVYDRT